jgi:polyhydroxyalkanoate synthesis regulator phasin
MPQPPDWKRYLQAGMQVTELRRSQARALAGDLVSTGQLARDQVASAVDEIVAMSRRRSDQLQGIVRAEVQRQLGTLGIATQADLRHLEQRMNAAVKKSAKRAAKQASKAGPSKTKPKKAKAAPATASKQAG